jgi:DNA-binding GntR family transcriptional regulator
MTQVPAGEPQPLSTLSAMAYESLRRDILEGVLPPGERLRIDTLRKRYRVGASPLREALARLSAERFVSQEAQRGFQVSQVSLDELSELTKTRCWINEIAMRESIANGDQAWEEAIVLAFHRLSRCPEPVDLADRPKWERLHRAFHSALIAACDSRWLLGFAEMMFDRADRYRYLAGITAHNRDIREEHRLIMEATIDRDSARAVALLNEHVTKTADIIHASAATRFEAGFGEIGAQSTSIK